MTLDATKNRLFSLFGRQAECLRKRHLQLSFVSPVSRLQQYPLDHWVTLRTNNPLERIIREVRRPMRV